MNILTLTTSDVTQEISDQMSALLLDMYGMSDTPPSFAQILSCVAHNTVLVALEGNTVIGMATLVITPWLRGIGAYVDDMVVRVENRMQGVGRHIMSVAISIARDRGAKTLDLEAIDDRLSACKFYESLGFYRINHAGAYRMRL